MNKKGKRKKESEPKEKEDERKAGEKTKEELEEEENEKKIDVNTLKLWSDFNVTDEIKVPKKLVDQVVGQEEAVDIIRKAAKQRRHILLIGEPGTGKSMLAQAMVELLPSEVLVDVLSTENKEDENSPKITVVKAGEGKEIVKAEREKEMMAGGGSNARVFLIMFLFFVLPLVSYTYLVGFKEIEGDKFDSTIFLAMMAFGILFLLFYGTNFKSMMMGGRKTSVPKLIVDNSSRKQAPFFDATGAHAGALLGDVKHDPLQSGGLGTPAHIRIISGMIHKANKGVLFIDEIGTLGKSQQDLLTAIQEKKLTITGRSEMSSGAMVITDPVPCDFILVAAGNWHDIENMHPALRSRIRGYGYEIYMKDTVEDTNENRKKIVQFIAQEVKKDGKIPHFTKDGVEAIINEFRRKAGAKNKLTLKFRELGGLIRAAGDLSREREHEYVNGTDVVEAKKASRTLEQQVADIYLTKKKEYNVLITKGSKVGRVNGLALIGEGGTVLPIVSEIAPALGGRGGSIRATGKLGEIANEAVQNVSAIIKLFSGKDIASHDIHIQFLQTYEGVEGDSASVSVAVAVISALEHVPVFQNVAMTGSLTVRGEVLPVGGVTQKIEAAIEAGLKKVIIPKSNEQDVLLEKRYEGKIEIVTAKTLVDVLKNTLDGGDKIVKKMKGIID